MDNNETRIRETITATCESCGTEYTITPAEQKFYESRGYELPKRCPECRKKRKEYKTLRCVDCNKEFNIRLNELEFFEKNGLHVPQRCPECREIKRIHNAERAAKMKVDESFEDDEE